MLPCSAAYPVKGRTVEVTPEEHYSYENDDAISHENVLRVKFFGLAFFKLIAFSPLQIAYRIYDIATGGCFYRGYEYAEHEHRVEMGKNLQFRERFVPMGKLTYHSLREFFRNIVLLALYPLYLVALIFASLVGTICPELARRIFSRVEPVFYVPPVDPFAPAHWLEKYGNLAAPCMQTCEFRLVHNLFRYEKENYHPETSRTLCNRLQQLIQKAAAYFPENQLQLLREAIGEAQKNIKDLGITDIREAKALQLHRTVNDEQEELRKAFLTALTTLEDAILDWTQRCGDYSDRLSKAADAFP